MLASRSVSTLQTDSAAEFEHGVEDRFGVEVLREGHHAERRTLGGAAPFGRVAETGVGGIRFFEVGAAAHSVERKQQHIGRRDDDSYKVSVQLSGSSRLVQGGRETVLRGGDISIYDTKRPYSIECSDDFGALILLFPKHLLSLSDEMIGQITAVPLGRGGGTGELALPFLRGIGRDVGQLAKPGGQRLAHMALDLVSLVCWDEVRDTQVSGNAHELLYLDIVAYIEDHLSDPGLSPAKIAAVHHVSPRLLRAVFQEHDDSVAAHIRQLRLERCRADIADPLYEQMSIRSIASKWMFTDPPHFSRLFRAAFGVSPSEWRVRELGADPE